MMISKCIKHFRKMSDKAIICLENAKKNTSVSVFGTDLVSFLCVQIHSNTVWNCITYLMEGYSKSHHPIFFSNHIIFNSSQFTFDFCFPPFPTYFASTHPPSLFWLINNWVMLFVYFSNLEGWFQFRSEIGGVFFRFLKRCKPFNLKHVYCY